MAVNMKAVDALVQSIRTGEYIAGVRALKFLAQDVTMKAGPAEVSGLDEVGARVTGIWPNTPVFMHGAWMEPEVSGDTVKVGATFAGFGAAPASVAFTLTFNAQGLVSRIEQVTTPQAPAQQVDKLPDFIKGMVNNALGNGTPMTVAYVDEQGRPSLSLRGSTVAISDTALAIWLRSAEGGLPNALKNNPNISLLYRDQKSRSTIVFNGIGHIATDEETRNRVFDMTNEVEQNHDPLRKGAALIIELTRVQGGTPRGGVRMLREVK